MKLFPVVILSFLVVPVFAQTFERVLIPIQPSLISGAQGSTWLTVVVEKNDSDHRVELQCYAPACVSLAAGQSTIVQAHASPDPAFIYLPADQASSVQIGLRTIATASDGKQVMMEIPVAHESDFTAGVLHLLFVPFDQGYRQSLRIFDLDGTDGSVVRLRIFTASTTPDVDTTLVLRRPPTPDVNGRPGAPAAITIANLAAAYPALKTGQAYLDVEPVTPGLRIWAFMTTTNNATQQFNHFEP